MSDKSKSEVNISRKFKGIWIPREIWLHPTLSIHARCLWAEIDSLEDEEKGGCFASDKYLAKVMRLGLSRLQEILKELRDAGFLINISFDGRQTIRKAINPINTGEQVPGKPGSSIEVPGKPGSTDPESRVSPLNPTILLDSKAENKGIAQTTSSLRKKAPQICFSFDERKFENISDEDLNCWRELYPSIDIPRQLKRMVEWCLNNPKKANSKSKWRQFITNWLTSENEKTINKQAIQGKSYDKNIVDYSKSGSKQEPLFKARNTIIIDDITGGTNEQS